MRYWYYQLHSLLNVQYIYYFKCIFESGVKVQKGGIHFTYNMQGLRRSDVFVELETLEDVTSALQLNNKKLFNNPISGIILEILVSDFADFVPVVHT